jgi:hypothetical protein
MTSVSGHLTSCKFGDDYERNWEHPPPESLFDAPIRVIVDPVRAQLTKSQTCNLFHVLG